MGQGVHFGGFRDVDRTATPGAFVRYLDQFAALGAVRAYKRESFRLLGAREGARLLDIGCGAGDDVLALARIAGPTGLVVGLDNSATMIAEAARRAGEEATAAEFRVGDVYALPWPDGTFDGCRADRILQHLADRGRAVAEMVRVTRPGGRIALTDPDWETLVVDLPDRALIRKVLHARADGYHAGWSGRELARLLRDHGLTEIAIAPFTIVVTDFAFAEQLFLFRHYGAKARDAGILTADELARWEDLLAAAAVAPAFFAAFTGFTVAGTT